MGISGEESVRKFIKYCNAWLGGNDVMFFRRHTEYTGEKTIRFKKDISDVSFMFTVPEKEIHRGWMKALDRVLEDFLKEEEKIMRAIEDDPEWTHEKEFVKRLDELFQDRMNKLSRKEEENV